MSRETKNEGAGFADIGKSGMASVEEGEEVKEDPGDPAL